MIGQFQTEQLVSERNEVEVKLLNLHFFINPHPLKLLLTQVINRRHKVNKIFFLNKGRLIVQDNGGYGTHRLGFGINEKDHIECGISIDGFRIIDELVDFVDDGSGLELEVEYEIDCVEDLVVGVKAFG